MANKTSKNYLEKIENEIQSNQSKVSLVLGALIVLVIGILLFNFFNKNKSTLGPAQQTQMEENQDVTPDKLPGKYTVKEGDSLFAIAEKYYSDGYKYNELAATNKLTNADSIEAGQVLDIPKSETAAGAWGAKIDGDKYTVSEGDWLSTIAGRAYGDVMAFDKIAKANNIANPDLIEPGTVLSIPRS